MTVHNWLVPRVVFPLAERVSGRHFWSRVQELRELQWRSPEELEARALGRLRPLLEHAAAHVPYYRELFRGAGLAPGDIRSVEDLGLLPVSRKADLRAGFPDRVVADNLPPERRLPWSTSGSSGTPFELFMDRAERDEWLASFLFFFQEWAGAAPWLARVRIAGAAHRDPELIPRFRPGRLARGLLVGERRYALGGAQASLDDLVAVVKRLGGRPYYLWSYPSYAALFAAQLLERGLDLAAYPRIVITSAEVLTAANAAVIEQGFRSRVLNHYSAWEVPHLAQTCPDNPALLHVNSERAIVRIVTADGSPAAPHEQGRVVITHLSNYVMPLINYDLGDWAVLGTRCSCGRGFPTIYRLEGRIVEVIRTAGGRVISPSAFCNLLTVQFPVSREVAEFQAVQTAVERVILRIVPTPRFSPSFAGRLKTELAAFLGPEMSAEIEVVERLEHEPSGKRLIIRSAG